VDRLFDWHAVPDTPIQEALARQKPHVRAEFDQRLKQSTLNLNEQGLNVALNWENPDRRKCARSPALMRCAVVQRRACAVLRRAC
jgi:translation initiation factor 5B